MNRQDMEARFLLLQINDSLFPIGGYSHSYGLETYIQKGLVNDGSTARLYIENRLRYSLLYTDLLAVRLAYEAAAKDDLEKLEELEDVLDASKIPMELREASRKLGQPFCENSKAHGDFLEERYFSEISGTPPGKSNQSSLCLRSFLLCRRDPSGGFYGSLSLCPDLCYGHKLCKDHSSEPVRGTEDPSLPPPGSGRSSFSCDHSGRRNVLRFCPRL